MHRQDARSLHLVVEQHIFEDAEDILGFTARVDSVLLGGCLRQACFLGLFGATANLKAAGRLLRGVGVFHNCWCLVV